MLANMLTCYSNLLALSRKGIITTFLLMDRQNRSFTVTVCFKGPKRKFHQLRAWQKFSSFSE